MLRFFLILIIGGMAFIAQPGSLRADEAKIAKAFLNDPDNIAVGRKLFQKQCARCHGQKAYPGKAPKLKPEKYEPGFVYRRITKGFRGMPSWKRRYNKKQRKSLTAYVMSKDFTN
ncbi:MAG: cytochrome c [Rhodospirillaceae bacterium]|nr:cytochrome c [Rhodospirillaceae bacterium]MBT4486215.1 cytochrome c [Rhodospirillaceae bacterium]MBT5192449.1 cytochrome c [Rhodospirillaceae bacterium]MBT5898825.1 cytochrome c [Rhodospirillaceae bacterium]MBT6430112.1 cytochrome c [Rhodospirillaceae bacterium]